MYASIILPTFNERENVHQMVEALRRVFGERENWEVIVVDDDSPDRTWELVQELGAVDTRIRCYRRLDRRGLSSAIVDGLSLGVGERLLVMDADFQHDIERVPALLAALDSGQDICATEDVLNDRGDRGLDGLDRSPRGEDSPS